MISLLWPFAMVILAPLFFLNSPGRLLFTYLVPLVPFVWVFDGYVSCLRTRTPSEVQDLIRQAVPDEHERRKWRFRHGEEMHTVPIGRLYWIIATKEDD